MALLVDSLQSTVLHVSVNLSRANAGVPEHLLEGTNIGTAGQKMSCKAVTQCVRTNFGTTPDSTSIPLDHCPDGFPIDAFSASRQEQIPSVRTGDQHHRRAFRFEVLANCVNRDRVQRPCAACSPFLCSGSNFLQVQHPTV